ncbi:hypothetical protein AS156_35935 [Bradyrhizobium macuxiense]|uniref:Uncharacterized protein n=2 Tax=Bradyrhizobium macuxiense TaxID=1755647 RepID=A0A109JZU6_9BRAD|nr:hypothetical protein AS156_35935 [Bradyrhizobium macuxiense]
MMRGILSASVSFISAAVELRGARPSIARGKSLSGTAVPWPITLLERSRRQVETAEMDRLA